MSLVLGIDPSAKKIAIVAVDTITHTVVVSSKVLYKTGKQTPESLQRALHFMDDFVESVDRISPRDRYAWVEDPLVGRGGIRSSLVQAYVSGIIRATLCDAGFTVSGVHVGTWKKQVCGNGNADKADVARVVKTAWPKAHRLVDGDGDLTDAAAIAIFGQSVLAGTASRPS